MKKLTILLSTSIENPGPDQPAPKPKPEIPPVDPTPQPPDPKPTAVNLTMAASKFFYFLKIANIV